MGQLTGTLSNLHTAHFARLISRYGEVPAHWYRRVGPCPNPAHVSVIRGAEPFMNCPLCGGTNEIYRELTARAGGPTGGKIYVYSAQIGRTTSPIELEEGDAMCHFLDVEYSFAESDRVLLSTIRSTYQEVKSRGAGKTDLLRYSPLRQILEVWLEPPGGQTTAGFSISADRRGITWGATPPQGTQYTVSYEYDAVWVVAPNSIQRRPRATNGDPFPHTCVLRKWAQHHTDRTEGMF